MSMELWRIGCPGPSLDHSRVEAGDGAVPVVYVNAAMDGADRCDFWSCWDCPNEIHEVGFRNAQRLGSVLLCGAADSGLGWRNLMMESKLWYWRDWMTIICWPRALRQGWFNKASSGPNYSVFAALSFAVSRGARRIEVFGADMNGKGYHSEKASACDRAARKAPHRWENRWIKERILFEAVRSAALQHGIEIVRL